jgi:cytochrome c oxidase assembly factor CtaG
MLAVVLVTVGLHLAGVRRVRRAGEPWSAWWAVSFLVGGVGLLLVATMSFVGVYQGILFSVRAAQTVLLLLVIPLFLALGRPISLALAALPRLRAGIETALGSRRPGFSRSRPSRRWCWSSCLSCSTSRPGTGPGWTAVWSGN